MLQFRIREVPRTGYTEFLSWISSVSADECSDNTRKFKLCLTCLVPHLIHIIINQSFTDAYSLRYGKGRQEFVTLFIHFSVSMIVLWQHEASRSAHILFNFLVRRRSKEEATRNFLMNRVTFYRMTPSGIALRKSRIDSRVVATTTESCKRSHLLRLHAWCRIWQITLHLLIIQYTCI